MRKDGELWVLRLLRKPPRAQGKRWSLDIVIIFFLSFVHQIRDRIFVYHVTIISYLYPIFNHIMSLPYNTHQTGPYRSLIVGDLFSLQNEYGSLDIYIYIYIYIYIKDFFFEEVKMKYITATKLQEQNQGKKQNQPMPVHNKGLSHHLW